MQVDTFVSSHPTLTDLSQSEPSLVRLPEAGLPVVAGQGHFSRVYTWPVRFVITAALGAIGGLVAAIVLNPAPLVLSSPSQQVSEVPRAAPPAIATVPIGTTTVVVPAVRAAAPLSAEDIARLRNRNRRLEALVQVLRQREAPRSARN